jgi:integrase
MRPLGVFEEIAYTLSRRPGLNRGPTVYETVRERQNPAENAISLPFWPLLGHYREMDIGSETKPKKPKKRGRRGGGAVRRHGKNWQARWVEDGERKTQSGFATPDDAKAFLESRTRTVIVATGLKDLGVVIPASAARSGKLPTFDSLVAEWFEAREAEDRRTVDEDRARWNRHLARPLQGRTLDGVDGQFLHRLVVDLKKPPAGTLDPKGEPKRKISGATAQRCVYLLSAFYVWAIREKLTRNNPVRDLARDPVLNGPKGILRSTHDPDATPYLKSRADVERLYRACPKPVNVAFLVSALAGLRPGEVIGLEWDDISLADRTIIVRRQVRHGRVGPPKNGKPRTVPIVGFLHAELTQWKKEAPAPRLVVPPAPALAKSKRGDGKVIQFIGPDTIKSGLAKAFKATAIKPMTFYQAGRHSFASLAVINGLSIYRLSKLMGHSDVKTTAKYAKLVDKLTVNEMSALDIAA